MFFLKGMKKTPWWVAAETDDGWYDLFHTSKPFIDTEDGVNLYAESVALEWEKNMMLPPLKMIHIWPLAWAELA